MKLSDIIPGLIYQFKSEHDLIRAIDEISVKFTRERDKIEDYLRDPRLVSAYTAFYLLTNIPKLREILKWLDPQWVDVLKNSDFIDLGAGPGTFSFAWKELNPESQVDFYQVETSNLMREQGKKLWDLFHKDALFQSSHFEWHPKKEKFLLFGHSANEMGAEVAANYIEKINPQHILFIEPGTKSFFPEMLKIREYLLNSGYEVLFPCPKKEACPMNANEDWCHQFIHVKHDEEVERLSQMAKKDRKLLPLTVHAYSRTFKTSNAEERLVRVKGETKFSFEWEVCHNNILEHYQVMKRDLSKAEIKALEQALAGSPLETEVVKTLEQSKRVKIKSI